MSGNVQAGEVSAKQMDELVRLMREARDGNNELRAMGIRAMGSGKESFCEIWPAAKTGLHALAGVLALVPGVSVFAGPAVTIVTAAGDAAAKAFCE